MAMDRFVNNLISNFFGEDFKIEKINPYLLYYFSPRKKKEKIKDNNRTNENRYKEVVDKDKSISDFKENFDAFDVLNAMNARKSTLIEQYTNLSYDVINVEAELINGAVPGIGIESPYESGLRLHYIYGIPFIPASSIKGAFAKYLKDFKGFKEGEDGYVLRFGSQEKVGNIVFLDAYPELPDTPDDRQIFDISIINTHYQKYYNKEDFPADYYSPIPNRFLIIKSGTKFKFHIIVKPVNGLAVKDIKEEFIDALLKQGVGAKTKVGFGHFKAI
jgi:CRISPR-associated protein Cmr6